jgi:hypothetical protein
MGTLPGLFYAFRLPDGPALRCWPLNKWNDSELESWGTPDAIDAANVVASHYPVKKIGSNAVRTVRKLRTVRSYEVSTTSQ